MLPIPLILSRNKFKPSYVILFFVGALVAVTTNFVVDIWFSYSSTRPISHTLQPIIRRDNVSDDVSDGILQPDRIWFVTATSYGLSQPPRLVRLAQAIFPVRHFVTWIIVQQPNVGVGAKQDLVALRQMLRRFDIYFLILSSRHPMGENISDAVSAVYARRTALNWILKNVQGGVLMFAPENFAYDHTIFEEMRYTKTLAAWPVGLKRNFAVTSPIVSDDGIITGYFDGLDPLGILKEDMGLNLGGYSMNIDFVRRNLKLPILRELTMPYYPSLLSLGLTLSDVKPLAENCTKIYVWRTTTRDHKWPKAKTLKQSYKNTNIEILLKKVYGLRYSALVLYSGTVLE